MNRAHAHWHPEAFDEPCQHDAEPSLHWPDWLVIAVGVVAILVAIVLVGAAFIALAGPGL